MRICSFVLDVLREELPAQVAEPALQRLVHAVADDVEEAALPAGLAEPLGDGRLAGAARDQVAHVDDRDVREVALSSHRPPSSLSVRPVAGRVRRSRIRTFPDDHPPRRPARGRAGAAPTLDSARRNGVASRSSLSLKV